MERDENGFMGNDSRPIQPLADVAEGSVSSCNFFLDYVGEVVLKRTRDGLSWKLGESLHNVSDYQNSALKNAGFIFCISSYRNPQLLLTLSGRIATIIVIVLVLLID